MLIRVNAPSSRTGTPASKLLREERHRRTVGYIMVALGALIAGGPFTAVMLDVAFPGDLFAAFTLLTASIGLGFMMIIVGITVHVMKP